MSSRRKFLLSSASAVGALRSQTLRDLREPRAYRTIDLTWVPMKDGVRIAVRMWLPEGADQRPVPAVIEYIPYGRMSEWTTAAAAMLAPHGIAFVLPDIRGSGDSEGVLQGEYTQQQIEDGVTLIEWLARQPWCNGNVGLRGVSWGGCAALQIAAMRPAPLKAIMAHCATDNRYSDDAHYAGGVLLSENFEWGLMFQTLTAAPPDPAFVGKRWREMWKQRLNALMPVITEWTRHQRYDSFWRQGSVQTDYSRISCPVYMIGGQLDPYRNFLPRLLTGLKVPHKALMGPWPHGYPYEPAPGPGLDWAVEEVRWWRQWLMGEETGILREPIFRAYLNTRTPSEVWPSDVPGKWVSEDRWPPRTQTLTLFLNDEGLGARSQPELGVRIVNSQETLGYAKQFWCVFSFEPELPPDQSVDDRRSCVFDSAPLPKDLDILGNPTVHIRLSSNQPVARIAFRLNEVTPDGRSWNVTWGLLNLTHRTSHTDPTPLRPGQEYDLEVSCYFTAHEFKKGNRIRVSVSESLWPLAWPSPKPVELKLVTGASKLTLPVRAREDHDQTPPIPIIQGRQAKTNLGRVSTGSPPVPGDDGVVTIDRSRLGARISASIREGEPNSCIWTGERETTMKRDGVDIKIRAFFRLASTRTHFQLTEALSVQEGQTTITNHNWTNEIKRDLM